MSRLFFDNTNFSELQAFFKANTARFSKVFLLTDNNVHHHCLPIIAQHVSEFRNIEVLEIEAGEAQKNIEIAGQLWRSLIELGADKNSLLVNLGGGVITDLGGFVAATFKRGMHFINIPTTVLGAVDAAIGGKTGVDFGHLKNQIGVIQQANGVFINPVFFDSLSDTEFYSGLAECVKHILLGKPELWPVLESWNEDLRQFVAQHINTLAQVKADVVAQDPYEEGMRMQLNYGHTLGHALESYLMEKGKPIPHGIAVVWGMVAENKLALDTGFLDADTCKRVNYILERTFTIPTITSDDIPALVALCKHDKKNKGNAIRFSLLKAVGSVVEKQVVSPEQITKTLHSLV